MIYLVHTAADPDRLVTEDLADDVIVLAGALLGVDSMLTRSKLYHGIKRLQGPDVPLIVAEITKPPKLKAAEPGAASWLRERLS